MPLEDLTTLAQSALLLSVLVSLPVVGLGLLVGLASALFQAATQVHDAALSYFPRFVAVAVALIVAGPWMGRQIVDFALYAFGAR